MIWLGGLDSKDSSGSFLTGMDDSSPAWSPKEPLSSYHREILPGPAAGPGFLGENKPY